MRMRIFTTVTLLLLFVVASIAQTSGKRKKILMEDFTGTWCSNCPNASEVLEQIHSEGYQISVIKYQFEKGSTSKMYLESPERLFHTKRYEKLGLSGYPNVFVDGVKSPANFGDIASSKQSLIGTYNTKINEACPIDIKLSTSKTGKTYTLKVKIDSLAAFNSKNVVYRCALVERYCPVEIMIGSEVKYDWLLHSVFRKSVNKSGQYGDHVDFKNEQTMTFTCPSYIYKDKEMIDSSQLAVIVLVQDTATGKVYDSQDIVVASTSNKTKFEIVKIYSKEESNVCTRFVNPRVMVKNLGYDTLRTFEAETWINSHARNISQHNTKLGFGEVKLIDLPKDSFNFVLQNTLNCIVKKPNDLDNALYRDTISKTVSFGKKFVTRPKFVIEVLPDGNAGSIIVKIDNSTFPKQTLWTSKPYEDYKLRRDTVELPDNCYEFHAEDIDSDSLCTGGVRGYIRVIEFGSNPHKILFELTPKDKKYLYKGNINNNDFSLVNWDCNDLITFNDISNVEFSTSDLDPATAHSGGTINYTSSNQSVATILNGKVHLVGLGTTTITASQLTGQGICGPSTTTSKDLTVVKGKQNIIFDEFPLTALGAKDFSPKAVSNSFAPITFTSSNTSVASIADSKIHVVGEGTTTITASQEGNYFYSAATPVSRELKVVKPLSFTEVSGQKIIVYPNPVTDQLNIEGEFKKLSIYNIYGTLIIESNENQINTSNLPNGIYFVKIKTENGFVNFKIVK